MSLTFKLALRYLLSVKGSTLLITLISFLGVFLSVCAILLTLGVFTGFQDSLKEKILSTAPHVIVSVIGEADLEGIRRKIENVPGVKDTLPFTLYSAILGREDRLQPVTVKAVNYREKAFRELVGSHLIRGELKDVVIGKGIADVLGVSPGGSAVLIFPTGIRTPTGFIPKTKEVYIGGIFQTGAYDKDFVIAYMDEKEARAFFKRGMRFEGIEIYIHDPYRAQEVKENIEKLISNELVLVRSWIDLNKPLFNALQLEKLALFLILLLMVLVASFNITSLLFVKSKEKVRDIAVLKTFGMESRGILRIFISVGLSIGFVGATLGVIVSFVLAYFINEYRLIRVPEEVYMMSYIPVHIKTLDLVATFMGTLLLSFFSSLLPAFRAAKENVVNILRNE
ncbi:lipoprotein-releasing system permease protein [Hydrogenivirga caldilitoris]|uniref:Lipoprotein-releasing system permease protein n=1 Tax=Hydrogenivirga caldilitoris TaxID=246264 RepID=A0A497XP51_9AQUI|nr:ABC transporter permease [Hydrogenivirga caldilitoris]RLJ70084.1 lipoprotein-releasing system permease protein [Hydrogenivirga caldilitoris]